MKQITAQTQHDQELLEGLAQSNRQAIRAVYDLALPAVIYWVQENSGTEEDARDLFQEALIAVFRKLEAGDFNLTCKLKSYLRIICRNLWMTRLRDRSKQPLTPLEDVEEIQLSEDIQDRLERSEEEQVFYRHFDNLTEQCRQILQWFFDRVPMAEIAQRLDSTEAYIKKRKFHCKEKLVKSVQGDPRYKELRVES